MELAILTEAVKVFLPGLAVVAGAFVLITFVLMLVGKGIGRSLRGGLQIGAVPMLAPLMMLAMAAGFGRPQQLLHDSGTATSGQVVENKRYSGESSTYAAIVAYQTEDGRTIKFEDIVSSSPPKYRVGDEVKVLYMPEAPDNAVIYNAQWWLIPAILAIGAVSSWIMVTIVMSINYRRRAA